MAKQWVRCKSCGFVIEEGKLGDVCPACGVKRIMFAPDTEKISDKRRQLLDMHIHTIIVHFPQGIVATLMFLAIAALFITGALGSRVLDTIVVLSTITPFVVVASFLTGLLDGKTRFRKLTTPYLRIKMTAGATLFVLCCAALVLSWQGMCGSCARLYAYIGTMVAAFICTAVLGKVGAGLATARFPG